MQININQALFEGILPDINKNLKNGNQKTVIYNKK